MWVMPATVLWFRRDLRLRDLPALIDAADGGSDVLACFILDPRLEVSSGPRRLQFLGDSLRELGDALEGRLLVTRGRPQELLPRICTATDARSVHISADFSPFGTRRDAAVSEALAGAGIPLIATGSPYLVSPGRVTKDDGSPYKVFTPFFNRWRDVGWRAPAQSGAATVSWIDPAGVTGLPPAADPRIPTWHSIFRPVRPPHGTAGRSSWPTDWRPTPAIATAPIGPAPAECPRI